MQALRRWIYWGPAATWMVLIFLGSTGALADSRTSRFLAPVLRWLFPGIAEVTVERLVFAIRKCAHMAEYGLLAVLVLMGLNGAFRFLPREWCWRRAGLAFGICVLYAVSDEIHQAFEPERYGSPVDVLIDTAGAAVALLALWLAWRWQMRGESMGRVQGRKIRAAEVREDLCR